METYAYITYIPNPAPLHLRIQENMDGVNEIPDYIASSCCLHLPKSYQYGLVST